LQLPFASIRKERFRYNGFNLVTPGDDAILGQTLEHLIKIRQTRPHFFSTFRSQVIDFYACSLRVRFKHLLDFALG